MISRLLRLICLLLFVATLCKPAGGQEASGEQHPASAEKRPDAQQYVRFPAVGLKLVQPDGFKKEDSFHGFGLPKLQSSVMAIKIPGPFSEVSAGFTEENMKARGWTLKSTKEIEIDGVPGYLIHFRQPAGGTEFLKWAAVFGDEDKTFMVVATFPEAHEKRLSERLKKAVLSARLDRGEAPEPGADVGFTIAVSPKLKLATQIGKSLLYTKNGKIPAESPSDPLFVAGQSMGEVAVADKRQFAQRRLRETAETEIKKIKSTEAIRIDGLAGYELLAEAEDEESGLPLQVYQVMLFGEDSYYLMQGLVGAEQAETYLPEFKAMSRSFERRTPKP